MNTNLFKRSVWVIAIAGIVFGLMSIGYSQRISVTHAEPAAVSKTGDPSDLAAAEQLSRAFTTAAEQVNPSVVTIFTETEIRGQQPFMGSPFEQFFGEAPFNQFFQGQPPQGQGQGKSRQMGLGSGVIVDADGIILTNNHVVDGADDIKVKLMDGREFEARVKGRDPQTDLAVLTIKAKDLQPIRMGNSDQARVGEWVLAIGSPFDPQLEHTVTAGIISGKGRSGIGISRYEDYIQTDAAINPGNSGGALINLRGELIGINTAIATPTGGNAGVGFAVPATLARKVMEDIVEKGKVERGWLGVYIQDITPEMANALKLNSANGVIVSKVQADSPAEKAGLKEEDVISRFNAKEVHNSVELSTWIAGTHAGTSVTLNVLRDGEPMDLTVKLGELTPEMQPLAEGKNTEFTLGLKVSNMTPELSQRYQLPEKEGGVVVTGVDPNGLAAEKGFSEGDLILKINRQKVHSTEDFNKAIKEARPGEGLLFYLHRHEGNLFLALTIPEK
ncbi:MAG: DegQ family serine endoprotease [Nitrospirae bacterium]|nr:DegQ family serine endoprotease [Nitrospirota bacterium]